MATPIQNNESYINGATIEGLFVFVGFWFFGDCICLFVCGVCVYVCLFMFVCDKFVLTILFSYIVFEIMSEEIELSVCDHDRQATLERANKEATSIEPVVT